VLPVCRIGLVFIFTGFDAVLLAYLQRAIRRLAANGPDAVEMGGELLKGLQKPGQVGVHVAEDEGQADLHAPPDGSTLLLTKSVPCWAE